MGSDLKKVTQQEDSQLQIQISRYHAQTSPQRRPSDPETQSNTDDNRDRRYVRKAVPRVSKDIVCAEGLVLSLGGEPEVSETQKFTAKESQDNHKEEGVSGNLQVHVSWSSKLTFIALTLAQDSCWNASEAHLQGDGWP